MLKAALLTRPKYIMMEKLALEKNIVNEIKNGLATAFINSTIDSNLAYRPQFITNDHKRGINLNYS